MVLLMAKENIFGLVGIVMKEVFRMDLKMVKVNIFGLLAILIQVNG